MLILNTLFGATPHRHALNVNSTLPLTLSISHQKEASVGYITHNNGGYRNLTNPPKGILVSLEDHGVYMTRFSTPYGELYINLHPMIAMVASEVNDNPSQTRLCYPTQNNGGYILNCKIEEVEKLIEHSFSLYQRRTPSH